MITRRSAGRAARSLLSIVVFLVLILGLVAAFLFGRHGANSGLTTALEQRVRKSELASDMQVKLLTAAEAEKSAVMAETDEASKELADESRRASAGLEADRAALAQLVEIGGRPDETERLREFSECWTKYRDVDREVLDLAVENTNLKALKLSFAPATTALERMQAALDKLVDSGENATAAVSKAAYQAMTAALKIHALESQHIAESRDPEMDRLESEMKSFDERVKSSLDALTTAGIAVNAGAVDEARAAYADFQKIHAQILTLSRRNSNIRSFAVSLGQKRKLTAECQEDLNSLQQAVQGEMFKATR